MISPSPNLAELITLKPKKFTTKHMILVSIDVLNRKHILRMLNISFTNVQCDVIVMQASRIHSALLG